MKLIAFDIDGTTIRSDRRVDNTTVLTLQKLKDLGFIIVPTTGRTLDGIPQKIRDLGVCDYAITSNGARITNLHTMEDVHTHLISDELATKILNIIEKYKVWVSIHADGNSYDTTKFQQFVRRHLFHGDFDEHDLIENPIHFIENHESDIEKIQVFAPTKSTLNKIISELSTIENINFPMSNKNYMEITRWGADKGSALEKLAQHLDIALDDVVAIGDDANDIPMLKKAGVSFAVKNSPLAIREAADYVTASSNNFGFAKAMIAVVSDDYSQFKNVK